MGIIRNNTLTEGLSGRIGGLVYKNYGRVTVVTSRPNSPTSQSVWQKTNRSKFRKATQLAKAVVKDATQKEYFQQKAKELGLTNAYTAAITCYMRNTTTEEITPTNTTIISNPKGKYQQPKSPNVENTIP